jgi:uncharacterized protein YjbJ (UPF0337 family)
MNKEHIKAASKDAEGKIKSVVGVLTDNEKLKAEGALDKAEGAVHKVAGDLKDAVK